MSASTPTQSAQGPPPVPPTKPVLSSPGAYMANFSSSTTSPTSGIVTAGIHGVNKSSEKPAIAARPIPPPTLPKYSSYNKIDRERNEFGGKFDRSERDKDGLGGSYRLASLDRLAQRQRLLEQNNGFGASDKNGTDSHYGSSITQSLQSKREMFFKSDNHNSTGHQNHSASIHNNNTTNSNHHNENTSTNGTPTGQPEKTLGSATNNSTGVSTNGVNHVASALNNLQMKERQVSFESNSDSNKIANDKTDREKTNSVSSVIKVKPKEMDGYVGFANLPDQVYRKAVKRGFEFTLMVVGESGLGKSTLINTMFLADIYNQEQHPGPSHRIKKTVAVETTKVLLKENCVNLSLTVVDTPGFGDAVDNSNCWEPVINFVESKYEEYLTAESRVHRKALNDNRVHCCLYFIAPSGHGLKPLDVEFMQRLCDKVNIIPVIAKADTMTPEEVTLFKKQILNEIAQHKIKIYDFPEPNDDEEEAKTLKQLRSRVPFAIVGANTVLDIEGKKIRGRRYPWGIAEVENLDHCDFIALRKMMIRTHLQDLKDVTNNVHYENYRCRKLAGLGTDGQTLSNTNPLAQMEEEKREHEQKLENMQIEMERVFQVKVLEKKKKLKDSEVELQRRHEERKKALENQIQELEKQRREFEQEKKQWEEVNGVTLDELRRRSLESNSKETIDGKEKKDKKKNRLF